MVISWPNASPIPSRTAPVTWFIAPLGLMIWLPTSPATQTLLILKPSFPAAATSTTSAKYPRWLKWNPTPIPVPLGSCRWPQPDFSAASSSTPRIRPAS
jgi:hypothetical protein